MFYKMLLVACDLWLLLCISVVNVKSLCLGTATPTCLTNLEEEDAKGVLNYVLSKYEEVEMKITGELLGVRGKRISRAGTEEFQIVFSYVDNTPGDIIQRCVFVVLRRAGQCEVISTVCNTFLHATPRPLLQREDLNVCEDGAEQAQQSRQSQEVHLTA